MNWLCVLFLSTDVDLERMMHWVKREKKRAPTPSPICSSSPHTLHTLHSPHLLSLCRQGFLGHSSTSSRLTSPSALNFQRYRSFTHNAVAMPSPGQPVHQTDAGQAGGERCIVDSGGGEGSFFLFSYKWRGQQSIFNFLLHIESTLTAVLVSNNSFNSYKGQSVICQLLFLAHLKVNINKIDIWLYFLHIMIPLWAL